jgi:hypothetical protein
VLVAAAAGAAIAAGSTPASADDGGYGSIREAIEWCGYVLTQDGHRPTLHEWIECLSIWIDAGAPE